MKKISLVLVTLLFLFSIPVEVEHSVHDSTHEHHCVLECSHLGVFNYTKTENFSKTLHEITLKPFMPEFNLNSYHIITEIEHPPRGILF